MCDLCGFSMIRLCTCVQACEVKSGNLGVYCIHRNSRDTEEKFGAREWGRTITALRPPDFESGASASSATRARRQNITFIRRFEFAQAHHHHTEHVRTERD